MIATTEGINQLIRNNKHTIDVGKISDGYHTFDELYDHRIVNYIQLLKAKHQVMASALGKSNVWRSINHSDGTTYVGWFLLGYGYEKGKQITYHLPINYWEECDFAKTIDKAPEFDGHTSQDVLERLKQLF